MNKRQWLVQKQFLNDEEKVIKRLKTVYDQSMKDINGKIANLDSSIAQLQKAYADIGDDEIGDLAAAFLGSKSNFTPEEARSTLQSMIQSKVYQKKYQEGLQKQVGDVLDKMHMEQFKTVSEYLNACYENGFVGTMFDLQGQGIPLCFPIDQEQMVRAVQLNSKIVEGYYLRMGENVAVLKKRITAEVSRGVSTGATYQQIAQQLEGKTTIGYTNAIRIARTEGHRIQVQAGMDACYKAKDMGADVVKQWDSTLDARTRDSHVRVDGEIRELDEKFSNGLMFPGDPNGGAAEVINCRCALLQRARWALGNSFTKMDNISGELVEIDADNYDEFKTKYFDEAKKQATTNPRYASSSDRAQFERYKAVLGKNAPETLDDFLKDKYNNGEKWSTLKYQYRTVNRYSVDGSVTADKILKLDDVAFHSKKQGFDYSSFTGKQKRKVMNEISNGGNAASMEFDGKLYFSHSRFGLPGSFEHSLYNGEYPAVTLAKTRMFEVLDLGDGIPRQFDTEAKFLEFVANKKKATDTFTVTILSEKHICKSCQGVVEQFKAKFPNSTVNIISGKKGYNGSEEGLHTWKHRKKVK